MSKVLLFLLALLGVWWVRRKYFTTAKPERLGKQRKSAAVEPMQACAHCGVHVPRSEGVIEDANFYCSEAHRKLGPRAEA